MFESPILDRLSSNKQSASTKLKARYVIQETQDIVDNTSNIKKAVSYVPVEQAKKNNNKTKKRKRDEEEKVESNDNKSIIIEEYEYLGLYTGLRYTSDGKIKDNKQRKIFNELTAKLKENPDSLKFIPRTAIDTKYDLTINGYENLPRPSTPLKVEHEDPSSLFASALSEESDAIVGRNRHPNVNSKRTVSLTLYDTVLRHKSTAQVNEDSWLYRSMRYRHTQIMSTLVQQAMMRGDYPLASRAFAMLIRSPNTEISLMWTVGLELLVWRRECRDASASTNNTNNNVHTLPTREEGEDEKFLNWLLVNCPAIKSQYHSKLQFKKDRAPDMLPALILSKLRHANPKLALEIMEEKKLQSPYDVDPMYDAYCGIALMQLMAGENEKGDNIEKKTEMKKFYGHRARLYFDKCLEKGGVAPMDIINFEMSELMKGVENHDVNLESSDSEDNGESEVKEDDEKKDFFEIDDEDEGEDETDKGQISKKKKDVFGGDIHDSDSDSDNDSD